MTDNAGFVRRCQTPSCRGALPFEPGQRTCRHCNHLRPFACASTLTRGGSPYGSPYEEARLRDALDAAFNSNNFVGRMSVLLSRVRPGTWSIDDAVLVMPPEYDSKDIPARVLVAAALSQAGLNVAPMPSRASEAMASPASA